MTTITITSGNGELTLRDDSGEIIARVPSETTITSKTDSHDVVAECRDSLSGTITSVDHDGDTILVGLELPAALTAPQCTSDAE